MRKIWGQSRQFDRPPARPRPAPIAAPTRQKAAIVWSFSVASAAPSAREPRKRGSLAAAAPGSGVALPWTIPWRRISAANQPPNAIQPQITAPRYTVRKSDMNEWPRQRVSTFHCFFPRPEWGSHNLAQGIAPASSSGCVRGHRPGVRGASPWVVQRTTLSNAPPWVSKAPPWVSKAPPWVSKAPPCVLYEYPRHCAGSSSAFACPSRVKR